MYHDSLTNPRILPHALCQAVPPAEAANMSRIFAYLFAICCEYNVILRVHAAGGGDYAAGLRAPCDVETLHIKH